ncbi:MAG: HDOD domain-containing protein [Calditrichaeota bacterium]|nr:HDOD domain-containing protein [Candidatus Cloacimonadota bacterium]MCB1046756.1 HDOD domain-containing protein [Calditrichota bacterium]MCB9473647.1 HDOD domain-containing protein [Candidatus Delongbacteria bacterium]
MVSSAAELVARQQQLCSLPDVYYRLLDVIQQPVSSAAAISEVIQTDPGLSARLLKLVNSAFYGFPRKIDTVSRAVTLVGTRQLSDLALATSVIRVFDGVPQNLITMESFWKHSLATGICARIIAENGLDVDSERLFVAGLLHDVGRLVMCLAEPADMTRALEQSRSREELLFQSEKDIFGFTHADVGACLMEQWHLPPALVEAVRWHHRPSAADEHQELAAVVHLADVIINSLRIGSSGSGFVPPVWTRAWQIAELELTDIDSLIEQTRRIFSDVQPVFLQAA